MNEQIKKCPFCGADVEVREDFSWDKTYYICQCKNCKALGSFKQTREFAIEAWNERATPNELREREQEIRIGILFRLARYIQRKVKLWVGCDVDEDITTIGLSLRVGDGYIHRLEQVNRREQMWRINKEIPALKFSGKEFLEALMDKSRKE